MDALVLQPRPGRWHIHRLPATLVSLVNRSMFHCPPTLITFHQSAKCISHHTGDQAAGCALLQRVESAAEAHAAFGPLFDVAALLGDAQRLYSHMAVFPGSVEPGWGQSCAAYVFDRCGDRTLGSLCASLRASLPHGVRLCSSGRML